MIGPGDKSSIKSVGLVSGESDLHKRDYDFHKAFEKIRAIHRTIGQRIVSLIRVTLVGQVSGLDEKVTSDQVNFLGMPLDEFVEAIELYEIQNIEIEENRISPGLVGTFIKVD